MGLCDVCFVRGHPGPSATATSILHLAERTSIEVTWVPTELIAARGTSILDAFDGLWIAPRQPVPKSRWALAAIRFARRHNVALLGTCAGFEHVALEYTRHLLGFSDAHHGEYDPGVGDAGTLRFQAAPQE